MIEYKILCIKSMMKNHINDVILMNNKVQCISLVYNILYTNMRSWTKMSSDNTPQ